MDKMAQSMTKNAAFRLKSIFRHTLGQMRLKLGCYKGTWRTMTFLTNQEKMTNRPKVDFLKIFDGHTLSL